MKDIIKQMTNKILAILVCLCCISMYSQGTLEEYKKALAVDSLFKDKVFNSPSGFYWLPNNKLWYVNNSKSGKEYILVDVEQKTQNPFFNHDKFAKALAKQTNETIHANAIDINKLAYHQDKNELDFTYKNTVFTCNLNNYTLTFNKTAKGWRNKDGDYWGNRFDETKKPPVTSPDSSAIAFIKNYNLYIKNIKTEEESQLSYDGSKGNYYSSYIQWSPDGEKIMAYKVRPGEEHKIYFVESSPKDQLQPKLQSRDYLKPGDQLPFKSPQLFIVESKTKIEIPTNEFNSQYSLSDIKWRKDSRAFTFEYNQRGHQVYKVIEVNATTGKVNVLINETSNTFIDYSNKKYRHDIEDGKAILWTSERDGWNHLYLYHGDGTLKKQLTKGEWVVRKVIHVDEENKEIYFTASGLDKKQDPYFIHYFKIDFEGKNMKRLTSENGNHKLTFSEDYNYYVDQYSRVDLPPVTLLKTTEDAKTILELQTANHAALLKEGWMAPEVFTAKGRDGITDIWGIIVRPTTFDPNRNYPIIEYIYAGPHDSFVPKEFHAYYWSMSALAELGFIVVQIDGMGTSNRSKAFHDVCWQNLKDGGFPDRKLWMKAAAKKYPYMNIDKVGIHGTSAGGQNAGAALVFNSDFYDVAVSSCGCHDNRMDKMWWNEQFMGYPIGPHYAACSNIENAAQLEGNLMLILGEVDDNVDPSSTMQFADALIKANKDFELVTIPGMGHSSGGAFGERKRKDFFVKHLLNVTPPTWNEIYNEGTPKKNINR
ncbi:Prolyl tripeptidyl peptidase precursor [Mariniflexile rhizosphaerae]|uniref:S9 family peptidase n=1 Tax=unclassified Mariniflexile TaxID=2643887 RepID=UPI000CB19537|nr:S9 family peptidase [Mariniflexile sp. TRM1-10]AXP82199.1 Prolyl tripeptidyl peptidase precursor [Mariniflexile sp. TRM1-10]PLB19236.1 MAG: Prolyl oligopeptidase [Flavobacteriaceae bacterium FS1-H7996/R]